MKTKIYTLFLLAFILSQSCNAQQAQTTLPKVENHLNGELDYTHETLDLIKRQANGEEISLGTINTDGTIHFNLPEYDIKALYDSINLQHYDFHQLFKMDSSCKDRDPFAKTPFDDVYSEKTNAIYIKQYGIGVAVLEAASDSLAPSSTYFWFYIDRAISFKDDCTKISSRSGDMYATINADIEFEKGWNFIEENLETVKTDSKGDSLVTQISKIHFTKTSPVNKKVKWTLRQIEKDKKIQTAKRLANLTPITKKQFEKWVPKKLGDLSMTTKEYGGLPERRKNKNNIHVTYIDKTQNKEIDLYVIDCAKSPDDIEMANFSYAMENRGKDKKDIKPYIAQFSERKKATQFMYKVDDRILVEASGVNINGEELWKYIQKLNVEKLLNK
jgi:hypothetical protein